MPPTRDARPNAVFRDRRDVIPVYGWPDSRHRTPFEREGHA